MPWPAAHHSRRTVRPAADRAPPDAGRAWADAGRTRAGCWSPGRRPDWADAGARTRDIWSNLPARKVRGDAGSESPAEVALTGQRRLICRPETRWLSVKLCSPAADAASPPRPQGLPDG